MEERTVRCPSLGLSLGSSYELSIIFHWWLPFSLYLSRLSSFINLWSIVHEFISFSIDSLYLLPSFSHHFIACRASLIGFLPSAGRWLARECQLSGRQHGRLQQLCEDGRLSKEKVFAHEMGLEMGYPQNFFGIFLGKNVEINPWVKGYTIRQPPIAIRQRWIITSDSIHCIHGYTTNNRVLGVYKWGISHTWEPEWDVPKIFRQKLWMARFSKRSDGTGSPDSWGQDLLVSRKQREAANWSY